MTPLDKNIKKFGKPKFKNGDKVLCTLALDGGILTVSEDAEWNGFTWMYSFEGEDAKCGQQYLTEPPTDTIQEQKGEYSISKEAFSTLIVKNGEGFCMVNAHRLSEEQVKENAQTICAALNQYPKLVDTIKELQGALETIQNVLFEWNGEGKYQNLIEHSKKAINKSKELIP